MINKLLVVVVSYYYDISQHADDIAISTLSY